MPYLVDSHCHLHDPEFFSPEQQTDFLKEASDNNVRQIICIGTSEKDSETAHAFAESHNNVFWTFGIHPEEATSSGMTENFRRRTAGYGRGPASATPATAGGRDLRPAEGSVVRKLRSGASTLVAIGEVGLDYHFDGYNKQAQWSLLERMLSLAIDLDLPCSFHVRDALPDFFSILNNFPNLKPSVLHSFTDSKENLERALSLGLTIGLNGIATFANLPCYRAISKELLPHLVLETDAPFLTPVPKRGIINRPGNIKHIAAWLSERTGESEATIAEITTNNVKRIFNLPDPRSETYFL